MNDLVQEIRIALRVLARRPAASLIAVFSLAVSLGVGSALFSVLDAVLLRPLPAVADAERLVSLQFDTVSMPILEDLRARAEIFSGLAGFDSLGLAVNVGGETRERVVVNLVTSDFFAVLGLEPALGSVFAAADDDSQARSEVVLSHRFWQRSLAGDLAIVGRQIEINRQPFTVIGVGPKGFRGLRLQLEPDLWLPLSTFGQIAPPELAGLDPRDRGQTWLRLVGRLRPGVSLEQARGVFETLVRQLDQEFPGIGLDQMQTLVGATEAAALGGREELLLLLRLMIAVVGLILLVACANVAGLLLVRAEERRKEVSLRLALGAGRGQLVRTLLVESALLALASAGLGVLVAVWTLRAIAVFQLPGEIGLGALDLGLEPRMVAVAVALAAATALLFGLVPALQSTRPALFELLGSAVVGTSRSGAVVRKVLVVGQVALSLVLLITAGLFVRSLQAALRIDLGYQVEGVQLAAVDFSENDFGPEQAASVLRESRERLSSLPGVQAVSWATLAPMAGTRVEQVDVVGFSAGPDDDMAVHLNYVDPGYFETLKIALVRGRVFSDGDNAQGALVGVVNEAMAQRFWPKGDAIGGTVLPLTTYDEIAVVGVVGDTRHLSPWQEPVPALYLPLAQNLAAEGLGQAQLLLRGAGNTGGTLLAAQREISSLAGTTSFAGSSSLGERLGRALMPQRMGMSVLGFLGLAALGLCAVGLYGIVSHYVARRTRELGIRAAFGASPRRLFEVTTWQGLGLVLIGAGTGLVAALALVRLIVGLLPAVAAWDPIAFVGAALLLLLVALAACAIPARRAVRVDPAAALRYE